MAKEGSKAEEAQEAPAEEKKEMQAGKGDKGDKARDCPFCGSDNVEMRGMNSFGSMQHHVACKDCSASGGQHSRPSHALDHWNGKHKPSKGSGKAVYG
jgi:Lar family restriction alleviation protein